MEVSGKCSPRTFESDHGLGLNLVSAEISKCSSSGLVKWNEIVKSPTALLSSSGKDSLKCQILTGTQMKKFQSWVSTQFQQYVLFTFVVFQTSCVQSLWPDCNRKPAQQHFRVQRLQEQDPDLAGDFSQNCLCFYLLVTTSNSGETTLRCEAAFPRVDVDEHCSKAYGRVIFL